MLLSSPFVKPLLAVALLFQVVQACITSLDTLALQEQSIEDVSISREYILCPNNEFVVGVLNFDDAVQDGQAMIPARPNMVVKCGDEGTRENACVIRGGDVHVDGTGFFGIDTESVDNFTVSGVTFEGSNKHNVWFSKPGRVVFQDCEFRSSNASLSPVFGDYSTDVEGEELSITFVDSRFSDNVYSSPPAQPALAVGNGFNNRFTFQSCIFTNNIMIGVNDTQSTSKSSLIETSGPLTVKNSCFVDNQVGVAPIMSYHSEYTFASNYQSNSGGSLCPFSAHITTASEYGNFSPSCTQADASECLSDAAVSPPSPTSQSTTEAPQPTAATSAPSQPVNVSTGNLNDNSAVVSSFMVGKNFIIAALIFSIFNLV